MSPETLTLLLQNRQRFLAFLTPRIGSAEGAEEVLQSALLKGVESGATLRHEESAVAWFYRLLRNALIDRHRRQKREEHARREWVGDSLLSTEDANELERTVCTCISALVTTLKPEYAEALRRVDLEGQSLAALAEAAGITPTNAKVRLHRARQALGRRLVQSCGPSCCERGCVDCPCEPA
ncbi:MULTISPECIES: RNA polymerase sigma factor [Myxococcaceae]|jgi:RNA polymerase sigma-70 factor (ECF subfamily)|uniref:RNA polymerase sigma factor n=1 Tax=Myxococcaceae TaxID=31 RepID=UPI001CBC6A54|nr:MULTISPECIES: RNA polymerase sigma factor [Myxococcaceae]MBZ4329668.1 RNA polymerase sigma factor [Corallococcus sp. AS-1-12]MBZ4400600.1 RNA polymerase sigma factor [Myxococcus sp. AS-1-15]